MKKGWKRVISGVLASLMIGQVFIFGDGSSQGIAHADTIEEIKGLMNQSQMANDIDDIADGSSDIEYFSADESMSFMSASAQNSTEVGNSLTVSGCVGLYGSYASTDITKIKVQIYDGDTKVKEVTINSTTGEFNNVTGTITGTFSKVRIECEGYLAREYCDMGYGSYQLGTQTSPEMLYPGDITNDGNINASDTISCVGARKKSDNFIEELDFDGSKTIDITDAQVIRAYILAGNTEYVEAYDVNKDGTLDGADYFAMRPYIGAHDKDANYYPYMDTNNDGIIQQSEYDKFSGYAAQYVGYTTADSYKKNITLTGDCYINGSASWYDTNLDMNQKSLTITDTLNFESHNVNLWSYTGTNTDPKPPAACAKLDVNGGYLYVGGVCNFKTSFSTGNNQNFAYGQMLDINGGTVILNSFFNFGTAGCFDVIKMTNSNDVLYVGNNWTYQTLADFYAYTGQNGNEAAYSLWTAGTIYFCGPVWEVNEKSGDKAIYSTGEHTMVFYNDNPSQVQNVRWSNEEDVMGDNGTSARGRHLNIDHMYFLPYGYSKDYYFFRPWFKDNVAPDYTLYRKGMEIGDGVHIATGNYTKSFTDLSVASPGVKSDFIRTYNSMNTEEGSFGVGWDFNIDVSKIIPKIYTQTDKNNIPVSTTTYYQVVLPDGSNTTFKDNGNGNYECLNAHSTMTKVGNEYIITNAAQSKYYFNAANKLYKVADSEENELNISDFSGNNRTVTDSTGKTYVVAYNTAHNRITSISEKTSTGSAVRSVTYAYDANNRLLSATNVAGGTETYEYDSNGRLCKITAYAESTKPEVTDQINYLSHGEVNYLINSSGLKQEYTYDKARQQTGMKEYDHDTLVKTYEYRYDNKYAVKTNKVTTDGVTYDVDNITYNLTDGVNKYDEMSQKVDIMGNVTKYERDSNGNVTKTTNPDGTYTLANYNDQNSVIASVDESGYATIKVYDTNGTRVLKEAKSITPLISMEIDLIMASDFDPAGYLSSGLSDYAVTTYQYYDNTSYTGGIKGLVSKVTDPVGNVTEYTYGTTGFSKGLVTEKLIYAAADVNNKPNSTKYEYNAQLQVSKETSPQGYVKVHEYNQFNNVKKTTDYGTDITHQPAVTITDYDNLGRKIAEYTPNYSAAKSAGTHYTYNPDGKINTQTDALGNITSFEYDAYGNVTKKTNPDGTINITEYDGLQREKATYFMENATATKQILTSTAYEFVKNHQFNVYGPITSPLASTITTNICSGLKTTKTTYIAAGKQITNEVFTDFRGKSITERTNTVLKNTNAYFANGQLACKTDAKGSTTKYIYGYLNQLTETDTPFVVSSGTTKYSKTYNEYYDNGKVKLTKTTVQQPTGADKYSITQNEYNALGLLTKVTLSSSTSTDKNITKYFYNADGVKTSMQTGLSSDTDTNYMTTEYAYSLRNQLKTTIQKINGTGIYNSGVIEYDLNGNVLDSTDANGNVTSNTYDALNRVLTSNTVNSADSSKNVSKSYTYSNMGRITYTKINNVVNRYNYDALGRKTKDYNLYNHIAYTYIGVSPYIATEAAVQSNMYVYSLSTYNYDSEMRLSSVSESGSSSPNVSYTYDANGNKATETLGNGVVSTYTYNLANKVTGISTSNGTSYAYSYYLDGSDASKARTESGTTETTNYTYDGLRRLVSESKTVGTTVNKYTYTYDDYGNRATMSATGGETYTTTYNYNTSGSYKALLQSETKVTTAVNNGTLNPNQTTTVQTLYTYDANGNQLTKTSGTKTETNTYDGLNQLIGYTDGTTTASYTYNISGLRATKTVGGETTKHIYDTNQQVIADMITNAQGSIITGHSYIRGTSLAMTYNYLQGTKSAYTYYVKNAHGDVDALTNTSGVRTKSYHYDAFGVEKSPSTTDTNPFRYCGEYFDKESGTIYLRARYYSPSIGRFISRDSYTGKEQDPLSLNLYTYCANNPLLYVDPSGHIVTELVIGGLIVAGIAGIAGLGVAYNNIKSSGGQSSLVNIGKNIHNDISHAEYSIRSAINSAALDLAKDGANAFTSATDSINEAFGRGRGSSSAINDTFSSPYSTTPDYTSRWISPSISAPKANNKTIIEYPGDDPTIAPSPDWEWKGKGTPIDGKGNWTNPSTGESLHPDLEHPEPYGPHWDYKSPDGDWYRSYPDGTLEPK